MRSTSLIERTRVFQNCHSMSFRIIHLIYKNRLPKQYTDIKTIFHCHVIIDDLKFYANEKLYRGFEKLESPRYGLQIGKFNDTEINFYLDLGMNGIRKDLPVCILKEIEREANGLLEANFVKAEDVKKIRFICYTKVKFSHTVSYKTGSHYFYRSYSIHIEIDKISDYYNDFDLDNVDMKFLKHADFCLCDRSWTEKPFDEFIRNELFCQY